MAREDPEERSTEADNGEKIVGLPACVKGDGQKPGIDCKKVALKSVCKGNAYPKDEDGDNDKSCRILPKCSDPESAGLAAGTECH